MDDAMKEKIKRLVKIEIANNGIPNNVVDSLSEIEKEFVEIKDGKFVVKKEIRDAITVVATGGVFDIIHAGHILTIKKAKTYGDLLVVIVANDKTVKRRKGREPIHKAEYRKFIVENIKDVDIAIIGAEDFNETIERVKPNVVVFGYDQKPFSVKNAKIVKLKEKLFDERFKTHKIIEKLGI